jgi:hypothetical protein
MNLPDAHPGDAWTSGTNVSSCCHKPLDLLSVAYWEFRMPVAKSSTIRLHDAGDLRVGLIGRTESTEGSDPPGPTVRPLTFSF